MDHAAPTSPPATSGGCDCGCPSCCSPGSFSPTVRRSVKRKAEYPGRDAPVAGFARVEVENEVAALRQTVASQQVTIRDLSEELEEERNSAATGASETMSMILRLQREKAEVQMEARQFRRFAEEKMAHDGREIAALEDLLFERDQAVENLTCQIRSYKHRLLSLGFYVADELDSPPVGGYPSLYCNADSRGEEATDLHSLEQRIYELERTPTSTHAKVIPQESSSFDDENAGGEGEDDDETDRVYTIDAIHGVSSSSNGWVKEELKVENGEKVESCKEGDEGDIKKLYMRLQALEADRESMREAIISMRTEKAQLMLLREIAQELCKEKPERRVVKKKLHFGVGFLFVSFIKWAMPFLFWRKKASRSR
ncbi:hypothetical protein AXF42_Ash002297 [Apostasia shenzhenica]|uniref:GTD-binding domain-containing protein n=1 Tax=Apostasia shenzhenica TaxID=1088818 RepID=A0A2I0AN62_9ASPA|nr:hypothetical protein AXF42_Ash002297 [Apostasia shenzhenica]